MAELVNIDYSKQMASAYSPVDSPQDLDVITVDSSSTISVVPGDLIISSSTAVSPVANNSNNHTSYEEDPSKSIDSWVVSAYGISACLVNATFSISPIFVAWLIAARSGEDGPNNDETLDKDSYTGMEVFFCIFGFIGILSSLMTELSLRKKYLSSGPGGRSGQQQQYHLIPVSTSAASSLNAN
jgi:hypothetical protein